jgi:hypothetical protein
LFFSSFLCFFVFCLVVASPPCATSNCYLITSSLCRCLVASSLPRCLVVSSLLCHSSSLPCCFAISLLLRCPTSLPRLARSRYLLTPHLLLCYLAASLPCYFYWLVFLSSLLFCKEELGETSSLTTTKHY